MANLKQELKIVEEQLEQLDEQIKSHCIAWAQDEVQNLKEKDYPEEIKILQSDMEKLDCLQSDIRQLLKEKEDLVGKQKEVRETESEEMRSRTDFYQVLGRRSFDLYKKGSLAELEGLDDIFSPLLDWEDKIRNADNELYRIRSAEEDQSLFKKLGTFIKKSSQSNIKKSAGDNLNKFYKKTGERLVNEGFFTEIAQNGLSDIFNEFQNKEEVSRKLKEEQDELERNIGELDLRISDLCGSRKPGKALKATEEERDEKDRELDDAFLRMGQSLYGREPRGEESFRKLIDELNVEREAKNREKTYLLTKIRIDELDDTLQKKIKERDQQQEKWEKEKQKWEVLQTEASELEQKKIQLEKDCDKLGSERGGEDS